jgi:hypothetical protein
VSTIRHGPCSSGTPDVLCHIRDHQTAAIPSTSSGQLGQLCVQQTISSHRSGSCPCAMKLRLSNSSSRAPAASCCLCSSAARSRQETRSVRSAAREPTVCGRKFPRARVRGVSSPATECVVAARLERSASRLPCWSSPLQYPPCPFLLTPS